MTLSRTDTLQPNTAIAERLRLRNTLCQLKSWQLLPNCTKMTWKRFVLGTCVRCNNVASYRKITNSLACHRRTQ